MASAPKKRDFFNGSQRLNIMETQEEGVAPESDLTRRGRNGFSSSQEFLGDSSTNYPFPSFSNRQSSPVYNSQDGCPPITSRCSLQTNSVEYDDSKGTSYGSSSVPEHMSWEGSSQMAPLAKDGGSDGRQKKVEKRKQRCRLCANHGKYVEIKGHKWYCKYRNSQHNCSLCEITRKKQIFAAKHHQITRRQHVQEQQQQQQLHVQNRPTDEACLEGYAQVGLPASPTSEHIDFPRINELVEETAFILEDENFFREITEKTSFNASQR